jgi:hypothetical protein
VRGFDEAYERLRAAVEDVETPPEEAFLPLFEALNWTSALSHLVVKRRIQIAMPPEDLQGLQFARGSAHHAFVNALEIGDVPFPRIVTNLPSGIRSPPTVRGWRWAPVALLPGRADVERDAYIAKLEGQPAHAVLGRLFDGLMALRTP